MESLSTALLAYRAATASPSANAGGEGVVLGVVDVYTLDTTTTIHLNGRSLPEALIYAGYLGATPISPSMAISIRTLELYRCIRLRQPSFSFQAFSKVICDLYGIIHDRRYSTALSRSFQVYLRLLRRIDRKVRALCGWDTKDWRVKNACAACCYKVSLYPTLMDTGLTSLTARRRTSSKVGEVCCHGRQRLT